MSDRHGQAGQRGRARPHPGQQDHEAELADGAVGQEQLDIGLAQRAPATDQHGDGAQQPHCQTPAGNGGEGGRQHGHEVHAGLDHGSGVEIGGDRRGCCHGARKPEVEGHQRRLAQGPHEHEQRCDGSQRTRRRCRHDGGQAESGGEDPQDDDADQHRQAADRGDDERGERRASVGLAGEVVTDEQVAVDRGQLPHHVQDNEVVSADEPQHRAGEPGQEGQAPRGSRPWAEVPPAVEQDQRTDAGDDEGQDPLHQPHS